MTKPIKIALCLSGEPRYSMFCFPYIYESFINLGNKYKVDTFCHFRKPFRAHKIYSPTKHIYEPLSEIKIWDYIDNIKLPDNLKQYKDFYDAFTVKTNLIVNPILMFDSMEKVFKLAQNYDKYDIYIRCRYDIFPQNKIYINSIIDKIIEKKFDLFIPEKLKSISSKTNIEYNDQFSIGNFKGMQKYTNILQNLENLINITKEWRGEKWLYTHLNNSDIKILKQYIPLSLIREVTIGTNEFIPDFNWIDSQ